MFHCNARFGSCYQYINTAATATAHRTTCASAGGALVSWNSLAEQSIVEAYFNRECLA